MRCFSFRAGVGTVVEAKLEVSKLPVNPAYLATGS